MNRDVRPAFALENVLAYGAMIAGVGAELGSRLLAGQHRMDLASTVSDSTCPTRALVSGALDDSLKTVSFRTDPYFGFAVPTSVPGIA
jgi:hypothetical protein